MQELNIHRILWGAILTSTFIFLAVSRVIELPEAAPPPLMAPVLGFVALTIAVVSLVLPPLLSRKALLTLPLKLVDEAERGAERLFRDAPATQRRFADPAAARRRSVAVYATEVILSSALAESIALLGFVLLVLQVDLVQGIGFFVVAWALLLWCFPTERKMVARLESAYNARLA